MIDLSRSRLKPYDHQIVGVQRIIENPYFLLADEMGAGKTKQTIDAAQVLYENDEIDQVLVIAPAAVRAVWFDQEFGEIRKHFWAGTNGIVLEYHATERAWEYGVRAKRRLLWIITNYDFIRKETRLRTLLTLIGHRTLLVIDESSAIKNHKALQTKACIRIRKECGRVLLLNGTPIANTPGDMYSQGFIMDPTILACRDYYQFRARYGVMGGYMMKEVVKWVNLEDMQTRFAPYVLRRLKTECLDLPPKLDPVTLTPVLTPETWKIYKEMRDEFIAWLSDSTVSTAAQAVVKALRLSQVTSGFIGGVQNAEFDDEKPIPAEVKEISREKFNLFLEWFDEQLEADPKLKLLVWSRWRAEVNRLFVELSKRPNLHVGRIWGGQSRLEREHALHLLDPRSMPDGPVVVIGTPASGSMGLNLAGAHTVIYLSNDYSLKTRLQSEDRVHRPGQTYPVSYFDMVAVGPNGQKTIDHLIMKALRNKEDLAHFTTSAWIEGLREQPEIVPVLEF